jgi:hypothetical protein
MFDDTAYLDRPAPRFAPPKVLALVFTRGLFIELVPGSNFPGWFFLAGSVGVGFSLSGFLPRFRLCPLAGFSFGHVFFAFPGCFVE